MKHKLYECKDPECLGCCYCRGGLASCTVCNGAESSLPSECPGKPMTSEQLDMVSERRLDYIQGHWLDLTDPTEAQEHSLAKQGIPF